MKRNPLINLDSLRETLDKFFDPYEHEEGYIYYNPYRRKWKRGRPSKEAYELRDWATGWDMAFYEAFPRHAPKNPISWLTMIPQNKIKKAKKSRTVLVKYDQVIQDPLS